MNDDWKKKLGDIFSKGSDQEEVTRLKTGLQAVDGIIGGGFPRGKIAEIYGKSGTGKTTIALQMVASAQKSGEKVLWIDLENAFDRDRAESLGINLDDLLLAEPLTGEMTFEAIEVAISQGKVTFIVVDSIPALMTRSEGEADYGTATMGGQARLISQSLRKIVPILMKHQAVLLFINQLRVNLMGGQYNPYTRPGGEAMKYYQRTCIELKRFTALKQGDAVIGYKVMAKAVKSFGTQPLKTAEMQLIFSDGFSAEANIFSLAVEQEVITRKGSSYLFGDLRLGVGQAKAREFLKENPEVMSLIEKEL